ncbi:MAG: right-handed parallel beta-helix repeat-containing protein, partial [Promethearchaeia archaeon]
MRRNSIAILMLTILVMQPILIMGIGLPDSESLPQMGKPFTGAQEPGSRLEPSEYTPHVPIVIDETSDFETQGWPGSGTPGDPYVISEVNITYDVDEFLISIINTNASFVIRDCYLGQDSLEWAIRLANTTAAMMEYVTVDSAQGGVYLDNSNNTQIRTSHIQSRTTTSDAAYAVYLGESVDCSLENNKLESEYRVVYGSYSHNLTLSQNSVYGSSDYFVYYLRYCNHTSSLSDTLLDAYQLNVEYSHYLTFSDLHIDGSGGLRVRFASNLLIENSNLKSEVREALEIRQTDKIEIRNTVFSSEFSYGIEVIFSDNVEILECIITDVAGYGIYANSGANTTLSDLSISDSTGYGIYLNDIYNCTVHNSEISDIGEQGFYADGCTNMTFVSNRIANTGDSGFHSEVAENLTLTDNEVKYADGYGFYHHDGDNLILHRNTVSHTTDDGIRVDVADDASVVDNSVSYSEETGLSISSSDRAVIQGNAIGDCEDGLSIDSSTNVTIYDNHISDVTQTGIDLYDMETSVISDNSVDANAREGMTFGLLDDCNITDNALQGCGFYWEPDMPIGYYEHLFENNTVNGNDVYYGLHEENQEIIADDWPQIFLINCTNMDVRDGTFNHITVPVELIHSDNCEIWNLVSTGNEYGLLIYQSENTSVYDVDITGGPYGHGIIAYYADGFQLVNSSIENQRALEGHGLFLGFSDHVKVEGCKFDTNYVNLGIKS